MKFVYENLFTDYVLLQSFSNGIKEINTFSVRMNNKVLTLCAYFSAGVS